MNGYRLISSGPPIRLLTKIPFLPLPPNIGFRLCHESSNPRVNTAWRLEEPKVVDNIQVSLLEPGRKIAYCRCWQSKKFPLCDGTHGKHNKTTGDNLGPLILHVPKDLSA